MEGGGEDVFTCRPILDHSGIVCRMSTIGVMTNGSPRQLGPERRADPGTVSREYKGHNGNLLLKGFFDENCKLFVMYANFNLFDNFLCLKSTVFRWFTCINNRYNRAA